MDGPDLSRNSFLSENRKYDHWCGAFAVTFTHTYALELLKGTVPLIGHEELEKEGTTRSNNTGSAGV